MGKTRTTTAGATLLAVAVALSAPAWGATGEKAGVAGAVRGQVNLASAARQRPKVGQKIATGDPIFLGDRITTQSRSGLQIMLLDRTTFTIGPDAAMVIDKFVYDPASKTGSMSARIVRGTFRFVSGAIAHAKPEAVEIKLPAATIGIRGTTIIGRTDGNSAVIVLAGPGRHNNVGLPASRILVTAGGKTVVVYRSGFGVSVASIGAPPSDPRHYDLKQLGRLLNDLNAQPLTRQANAPPPPPRGPHKPPAPNTANNTPNAQPRTTTTTTSADIGTFADTFTGQSKARGLNFLRGPSAIGAFLGSVRGASSNPGTGLAIGHANGNNGRRVQRRCRGRCNHGKP